MAFADIVLRNPGSVFNIVLADAAQTISPSGLATAEAVGTHKLNQSIVVAGVATAEAVGTHKLNQFIAMTGVASAEAIGSLTILTEQLILPSSITTAEAFGTPSLAQYIQMLSIESEEALGAPALIKQILRAYIRTRSRGTMAQVIDPNRANVVSDHGKAKFKGDGLPPT